MSTLHDQLHALAAHVRDPATHPGPAGIEDRRLAIYRNLVFNNLDGLLAGTFPVIRRTLGDGAWRDLLRSFLATHRSETPLFTRLGLEFTAFLGSRDDPGRPWLAELAHYEWAELGLQLSDAALPPLSARTRQVSPQEPDGGRRGDRTGRTTGRRCAAGAWPRWRAWCRAPWSAARAKSRAGRR